MSLQLYTEPDVKAEIAERRGEAVRTARSVRGISCTGEPLPLRCSECGYQRAPLFDEDLIHHWPLCCGRPMRPIEDTGGR